MSSEYTPTTEQVRELFLQDCLPGEYGEAARQFDRWLQQVTDEAWEKGAAYIYPICADGGPNA